MADYAKPLPVPDPTTQPFWDSLKAHAAQIQFSPKAGRWVFYPRNVCPYTGSRELEWRPISGQGKIHAFTIAYRNPNPAFQPDLPYAIVLVELEEGARIMGNLVDTPADPAHVRVDMPVELVYDDVTPEVTLPKFRPLSR
jgi:uncharacterized OB-fold protein